MFSKPFEPSGRAVLAEELFDYLKDAIVSGDLQPGDRLVEDAVAQATSVSRTPVREALRKLRAAGLVDNKDRSFVVAELSSAELRDIWAVMEYLQGLATRLAAVHRSTLDLVRLQDIVTRGREATDTDDVAQIVELNRQFHSTLHHASGNRFLADLIASLLMRIERNQDFTQARRREQAQTEHESVLAAIEQQDPEAAEKAVVDHLRHQLAATVTVGAGQ
jgi:DNA-binding GntR family transcriptional regulator